MSICTMGIFKQEKSEQNGLLKFCIEKDDLYSSCGTGWHEHFSPLCTLLTIYAASKNYLPMLWRKFDFDTFKNDTFESV